MTKLPPERKWANSPILATMQYCVWLESNVVVQKSFVRMLCNATRQGMMKLSSKPTADTQVGRLHNSQSCEAEKYGHKSCGTRNIWP